MRSWIPALLVALLGLSTAAPAFATPEATLQQATLGPGGSVLVFGVITCRFPETYQVTVVLRQRSSGNDSNLEPVMN
jgi:hypothetical protein